MRSILATATGVLCFVAASHADIIAVTWTGSVVKINEATGGGAPVGVSGFSMMNSMARDGSTLYVHSGNGGGTLVKIDPMTGVGSAGPVTGLLSVRGLAVSPAGKMFAIEDVAFGSPDVLYSIDIGTGATTLIGPTNHIGIQGLTFAPDGTLYAWDLGMGTTGVGAGLVKIDPNTGASTDVNPGIGSVLPAADNLQALAFSGAKLYGCRNQLYEINTSDGSLTLIGSGGYSDIRGIEGMGPACIGDINGDGKTCQGDLGILLANYNTNVPPNTLGDLDGDGFVGQSDLGILLADFGCGGC